MQSRAGGRDFGDQFVDNRLAERVEVLRPHYERVRPPRHVVAVIGFEPARRGGVVLVPRQRLITQDHKTVDRYALRNRITARRGDVAPGIVGAVARYVDGATRGTEGGALELRHREIDAPADRSTIGKRTLRFVELARKFLCGLYTVDHHPIDDDFLSADSRPFQEADCDATLRAGTNGFDHARAAYRSDVSVTLQLEFDGVDAARHIGGKHEQEIDRIGC